MTINEPAGAVTRWLPDAETVAAANLTRSMQSRGVDTYADFHRWSITSREAFWEDAVERLGIVWHEPPHHVLDPDGRAEAPGWMSGARLNIAESCFHHDPAAVAIVYSRNGGLNSVSRHDLRALVLRFARGFVAAGLRPGDPIAVAMPMTVEAVAAYLGIVWAGGVVVSIADSFAPAEIATRLRITGATTVVTQDVVRRGGKELPMYAKVVEAGARMAIVVETGSESALRSEDVAWDDFLGGGAYLDPVIAGPDGVTNVLFSSGTTGEPKAIPWTQLTPIKAAMDGYYHQDVQPADTIAWPTNLGWMMGPWLIYASLINGASMALYGDVPTVKGFGEFIQDAGVTILGVVPSLVAAWRSSGDMEDVDWGGIRLFSSTGEVSNASDMGYLMTLAGNKPVIEYCGGTEIGGGYLTGTVLQPSVPARFTTPALGLDIRILDEDGEQADSGELFIVPPSIGLSEILLNRDHHEVYYAGTPSPEGLQLRRHGDHVEAFADGNYQALGRIDDTMNLGGIKVSSAEIERVIGGIRGVAEVAAIAAPPTGGGPARLVVFAVPELGVAPDPATWRAEMQAKIRESLNPLFKVHEVVPIETLPRTPSAKVMRRRLRDSYPPDA